MQYQTSVWEAHWSMFVWQTVYNYIRKAACWSVFNKVLESRTSLEPKVLHIFLSEDDVEWSGVKDINGARMKLGCLLLNVPVGNICHTQAPAQLIIVSEYLLGTSAETLYAYSYVFYIANLFQWSAAILGSSNGAFEHRKTCLQRSGNWLWYHLLFGHQRWCDCWLRSESN